MTNSARVHSFLFELKRWAATQAQIQAVALIGSHARGTATDTSDVDLIVIVSLPNVFLEYRQWTELFGNVVRDQIEDYGECTSLRVWYSDGLEVEYGFCKTSWAELPLDYGTQQVISGGMKVLFERTALLSPLLNTV
jgi:predicted nucleotidyltransferase